MRTSNFCIAIANVLFTDFISLLFSESLYAMIKLKNTFVFLLLL